jgi:hypothetical protein
VEVRKPTLRIVEYRHSVTAKYVIEGARINGKAQAVFFRDEALRRRPQFPEQ